MILIYPEKLSSVTADSEDGSFPAVNLEDDKPKKYWRSGGTNVATLTATVASGSDQVSLFNTNATSATVVTKLLGVQQESFSINMASPHSVNRFWQSYTAIAAVHTIEITLSAPTGEAVYGGVLRAGLGVQLRNPKYGIGEGRRDFSIIKELNNGAFYIRKRNAVREIDISFLADRADQFYEFTAVWDFFGPQPLAILAAEDVDDNEWAIFGHIISPFSGKHSYFSHTDVSYKITEAV